MSNREDIRERIHEEHQLIRLRILGWTLIGLWQVLSLASEFIPIDLNSRAIRITGKVLGLAGLILVAYGFERLAELSHRLAGLHD